jgi:hypothetical protein
MESKINSNSKWRIKLEEYDYEIVFKGASNTNADAMSRVSSLTADKGVTEEKRQQVTMRKLRLLSCTSTMTRRWEGTGG